VAHGHVEAHPAASLVAVRGLKPAQAILQSNTCIGMIRGAYLYDTHQDNDASFVTCCCPVSLLQMQAACVASCASSCWPPLTSRSVVPVPRHTSCTPWLIIQGAACSSNTAGSSSSRHQHHHQVHRCLHTHCT
jgi:hypothetical protein